MNTLHLFFLQAFSCPSDVTTSFFFVSTVLSSQRIECLVISGLSQQLLLVFDWQRPKNLQNGGLILPGLTAAGIRHSCSLLLMPLHCAFLCKCGTRTGMGLMRGLFEGGQHSEVMSGASALKPERMH